MTSTRAFAAGVLALLALLALGGCRGIIGYEDFVLDPDASADGARGSSASDGGDAGTPGDSAADTSVGPDGSKPTDDCASKPDLPQCFGCCRGAYGNEWNQLKMLALNQCYCAGKGCETECGSWCVNPAGAPPMGPCGLCLDTKMRACTSVLTTCKGQANCAPAAVCVESCP